MLVEFIKKKVKNKTFCKLFISYEKNIFKEIIKKTQLVNLFILFKCKKKIIINSLTKKYFLQKKSVNLSFVIICFLIQFFF